MADRNIITQCCIAGGGPAGMMLGFLLARAGVDIVVLEKHADFLRDFRGDTVHPSTLEIMHELGLLQAFLRRPHRKVREVRGRVGDVEMTLGDFSRVPTHAKFLAFMPQWDFLDFIVQQAQRYPGFHLLRQATVTELIQKGRRVTGVMAETPEGALHITGDLVAAADGRHSTVREKAGMAVEDLGAPIDVLWMRLPRVAGDPEAVVGNFRAGRVFVMLDRGDYWQCALVIAKGGMAAMQARGLDALKDVIVSITPFLKDRVGAIQGWDDIKLLTVAVNRLRQWWRPGLLCIGDAAHAMSPLGGVGINLAIQDAVAAANILARPLLEGGPVADRYLQAVQKRRMFPVAAIQKFQTLLQDRVISRLMESERTPKPALPLRLLDRFPPLRAIPARILGVGLRPEHVRTPAISSGSHTARG